MGKKVTKETDTPKADLADLSGAGWTTEETTEEKAKEQVKDDSANSDLKKTKTKKSQKKGSKDMTDINNETTTNEVKSEVTNVEATPEKEEKAAATPEKKEKKEDEVIATVKPSLEKVKSLNAVIKSTLQKVKQNNADAAAKFEQEFNKAVTVCMEDSYLMNDNEVKTRITLIKDKSVEMFDYLKSNQVGHAVLILDNDIKPAGKEIQDNLQTILRTRRDELKEEREKKNAFVKLSEEEFNALSEDEKKAYKSKEKRIQKKEQYENAVEDYGKEYKKLPIKQKLELLTKNAAKQTYNIQTLVQNGKMDKLFNDNFPGTVYFVIRFNKAHFFRNNEFINQDIWEACGNLISTVASGLQQLGINPINYISDGYSVDNSGYDLENVMQFGASVPHFADAYRDYNNILTLLPTLSDKDMVIFCDELPVTDNYANFDKIYQVIKDSCNVVKLSFDIEDLGQYKLVDYKPGK